MKIIPLFRRKIKRAPSPYGPASVPPPPSGIKVVPTFLNYVTTVKKKERIIVVRDVVLYVIGFATVSVGGGTYRISGEGFVEVKAPAVVTVEGIAVVYYTMI